MSFRIGVLVLLPFLACCLDAGAETYRCVKGGQVIFSDLPCAAGANRVDEQSDRVSREQRRQAENVNQNNRGQLSELEYRAARDKNVRGGVIIIDSEPASTPSTRYPRSR